LSTFSRRLLAASETNRSLLCVGLDPDPSLMAVGDVAEFNRAIVRATRDLVCAYKPNVAFYESLGLSGLEALRATVDFIREEAPGVVVLADVKRGDIGSTNLRHAASLFDVWGFDAATVNGYVGGEAMEPLLAREDKGVFVLCRTSNPGAAEIQDLTVVAYGGEMPLYQAVATRAARWNRLGNVGLVVGATYPSELRSVRSLCPNMPILLPAVGAQSGDLAAAVAAGADQSGRNLLVSSSRAVTYASRDPADFESAARDVAVGLRDRINEILDGEGKGWPRD